MNALRSARAATMLLLAIMFALPISAHAAPYYVDTFDTTPVLAVSQTPGAWYQDRYSPAAFESAAFGGDSRLRIGISAADSATNRPPAYAGTFYNTQGRKYDLGAPSDSYVAGFLYVGSDWESGSHRSDLWATCFGATGEAGGPTAYPVIGFISGTGFRVFDSAGDNTGWHDVGYPDGFEYGQWHALRIELTSGGLAHYLDGKLIYTDVDATDSTQFGNMMLQAYNFGEDYNAYWDDVSAGPLDHAAPITTDNHVANNFGAATITLTATDTISGVATTRWKLDGGAWTNGTTVTTSVLGAHSLQYRSTDFAGNQEATVTTSFTVVPPTKTLPRIGGKDRYEVAINAATDLYPAWAGVTDVVIASGEDRAAPDALTAAGLAGALDAPLLLSRWGTLDTRLASALASMPAGVKIHVVGGAGSVSAGTIAAMKAVPSVASVDRVGGVDRYEVAASVARNMATVLGSKLPDSTLIANGNQSNAMFDALTSSAISANMHYPVLLVRDRAVPATITAVLEELDLSQRYIVGGPASVSEAVRVELGVAPADRFSGANRYEVAKNVATHALDAGWLLHADAGFASKLPDAATGGAFMGKRSGVMLYVRPTSVPDETSSFITTNKDDITRGWVFGGTASVSEPVRQQLLGLMQ